MNWYKKANSGIKIYVGNCITGLDEPHFCNTLEVYDATDLAQLVENEEDVIEINIDQFLNMVGPNIDPEPLKQNPENYEFFYHTYRDIAWFYNINEDVEYFYK